MTDPARWAGNRIRLMSPVVFRRQWLYRAGWPALVLAVVAILALWRGSAMLPDVPSRQSSMADLPPPVWREPVSLALRDWTIVQNKTGLAAEPESLNRRFRLAGTFFEYGGTAGDKRKAIIDDLSRDSQVITSEGERLGEVEVLRIYRDRVVLRDGADEVELWLGAGDRAARAATGVPGDTDRGGRSEFEEPGAFGGKRIAKDRWVFMRDRLLAYYQELMDEPERLVAVMDSLKPLYEEEGQISGYQLGIEGEAEFFAAVGMHEGDIVRKVNSMPMINRRRAEHFIRQFVENSANAFVVDVERAGAPVKLVYEIR